MARFHRSLRYGVEQLGDVLRYTKLVESEPALIAASWKIQLQYEELLTSELSWAAGEGAE